MLKYVLIIVGAFINIISTSFTFRVIGLILVGFASYMKFGKKQIRRINTTDFVKRGY